MAIFGSLRFSAPLITYTVSSYAYRAGSSTSVMCNDGYKFCIPLAFKNRAALQTHFAMPRGRLVAKGQSFKAPVN